LQLKQLGEVKNNALAVHRREAGFLKLVFIQSMTLMVWLCAPIVSLMALQQKKWNATFVQDVFMDERDGEVLHNHGGLSQEDALELFERTPGYVSWQGEQWLVHCGGPCRYLGDASSSDVQKMNSLTRQDFLLNNDWAEEYINDYEPFEQNINFYKFECLHCKMIRFAVDMS
jgi:uncharacterized protein CbrC (UPF0167 family)